jgi:hypothetical protein
MRKIIIISASLILLLVFIFKIAVEPSSEPVLEPKQKITGHFIYEEMPAEETEDDGQLMPDSQEQTIMPALPPIEMVSKARCIDDRIELFLTNPTNNTLTLAKDIKIHVNGMIVADPKCSRDELMPGKKAFCSDVSGHLAIREGKENTIQINMGSEKKEFVVNCSNTNPSYEIIQ